MKLKSSRPRSRALVGLIRGRFVILLLGVAFWVAVILCRLINVQIFRADDMRQLAERQQKNVIRLAPSRGRILDVRMRELALGCKMPSVYASPPEVENPRFVAAKLAEALGISRREVLQRLQTKGRSFVWIKRKVSLEHAERVTDLDLKGIHFLQENGRKYPKGELAANLIGYVGIDNNGLSGLEHGYEDRIGGQPGFRIRIRDAKGNKLLAPRVTHGKPVPGNDLVLTIDEVIQYYAERDLAIGVERCGAKAGTVLVMRPDTGEILAMAVHPTFDPNCYRKYASSTWRNRVVTDCFEPGSVMKIVIMAACLEEGLVRLDEVIDCGQGGITVSGVRIDDHRSFDRLVPASVIAQSSNVGAIRLGLRLGRTRLHRYLRAFGFGSQTGIGLPGETRGILREPSEWSRISAASLSIGQELSVSTLQLGAAFAAIANQGVLMKPRVVLKEISPEGKILRESKPSEVRRVISNRTASILVSMMEGVVEEGTGTKARVPGFRVAGKTGTAQKAGRDGRYEEGKYFGLFAGFAPSRDPQVVIVVAMDEPKPPTHHGGDAAAPVFSSIAAAALRYLRVPSEGTEVQIAARGRKSDSIIALPGATTGSYSP